MKKTLLLLIAIFSFFLSPAQSYAPVKKYPSLLWEISGNGIKKPSYLIGTMHVSNKLAFNLPDSFYYAIRNAQVVALETNPETWQEDLSKYDLTGTESNGSGSAYINYLSVPNDYLSIKTLQFSTYERKIERALSNNPSTINSLLYRSYGNESSDFEEDTYLDMYIFQCGKKWGKKVTGVEDYGQSMQLMAEAYKDAAKDKKTKDRSYGDADDAFSTEKLQEAYRTGDLDLLDSINKYNSESAAFDEKFLYRRNEIQANSIDSILRSGSSLFVGVGAAHLPGERGVIEDLRRKGYTLRPVKMGERAGRDKDLLDKVRVPVTFRTETAADGLFKVDIPGKFYKFGDDPALDQKQYADMSNGSYYMVTRIMTNALVWNQGVDDVFKIIDSLLYENIPGKIISRSTISKGGYKGFDITNKTRRGEWQRYNIYITPFEVVLFKMSGNGDYILTGTEAKKFFGSIQFNEYDKNSEPPVTKKYSPPFGGFTVDLPHTPYVGNEGSWIVDAVEKTTGTHYRIIRTDIHNYHFTEVDSFDLGLMEESFAASDFIDTQLSRKFITFKGYPAMECRYKDKQGGVFVSRFIIQGPHYYTLLAHGKKETAAMTIFLNSFEITPFTYGKSAHQPDSSLYFSSIIPVIPGEKKVKIDMNPNNYYPDSDIAEEPEAGLLESGVYRNRLITNDSTGEKIYVTFYKAPMYYYTRDTAALYKEMEEPLSGMDSTLVIRFKKKTILPGKLKVSELIVSDSGSSRALWGKSFYKDGIGFYLVTQIDTLTKSSVFLQQFFENFLPSDKLQGVNPFTKKSTLFFEDFLSKDSNLHKRAIKFIDRIYLDSSDLPHLKEAIVRLNWKEKKYLDVKEALINKLGKIKTNSSADFLKLLYYSADDTVQLQYSALKSLLQHKTKYAFTIFRDIVSTEPPVLEFNDAGSADDKYAASDYYFSAGADNGNFLDELADTLKLTKTILPDLLPLLNLADYKSSIMKLLGQLADSNLVNATDYALYFSKFMMEAKQNLKKQFIAEKKRAIKKAEEDKEEKKPAFLFDEQNSKDAGNDNLSLYATLLLPFWETNSTVQPFIQQMLQSTDKQLKYNTMLLLLKNNKPFPDTLVKFFASLDEYRFQLYSDLKEIKRPELFPAQYNNHRDLGISSLLDIKIYDKPDSLVYIDRLMTEYNGKRGFIYFYRYKAKKDDLSWKLATMGLVPENPNQFVFEDSSQFKLTGFSTPLLQSLRYNQYALTGFSATKWNDKEPVADQLKTMLKKIINARRKSAKNFYEEENDNAGISDFHD